MHTTVLKYEGSSTWGPNNTYVAGRWLEAIINHNGDWSGDAFVRWDIVEVDGRRQARSEVVLPGRILKALVQHSNECAIEYLQDAIRQLGKQT